MVLKIHVLCQPAGHQVTKGGPRPSGLSQYCWASSPSYSLWVVQVPLHGKGLDHLMQPKLLVLSSILEFIEPLEVMHEALVPLRGVPFL